MALSSPGVEVTVIDESFYTSAEPGSVPLIVVATAENKLNGAGTAVAAGTLASNSTNVYRISSQRELVETFGVPFFEKTATNNPVHGGERNEYGLLAAYSLLGATNSAFIMRANVDLNELAPSVVEPGAEPRDGTWWVNTATTSWGVQEWNNSPASIEGGQKFATKIPTVLTDRDIARIDGTGAPRESVGNIGDYAVVFQTIERTSGYNKDQELAKLFYKSAGNTEAGISPGTWVLLGSKEWTASIPVVVGSAAFGPVGPGSTGALANLSDFTFSVNGTEILDIENGDTAETVANKINSQNMTGVYAESVRGRLYIYSDGETDPQGDSSRDSFVIIAGSNELIAQMKISAGSFPTPRLVHAPHTRRPQWKRLEATVAGFPTGSVWIKTTEPNNGARVRVAKWSSGAKTWVPVEALMFRNSAEAIFFLDRQGGGRNIGLDTLFTQFNAREYTADNMPPAQTAEFRIWRRRNSGATTITSRIIEDNTLLGENIIGIKQTVPGSATMSAEVLVSFSGSTIGVGSGLETANAFAAAINAASFVNNANVEVVNNVVASVTEDGKLVITHRAGGDIRFRVVNGTPMNIFAPYNIGSGTGTFNFYELKDGVVNGTIDDFIATGWIPLAASASPTYYASPSAPLEKAKDGQLWFNPTFDQVDIMIHNGATWVGYGYNGSDDPDNIFGGPSPAYNPATPTDPRGPIISASRPEVQSDGSSDLVDGDLWISTADLENYPTIYRYDGVTSFQWILLDKTDQTTEDGVLFADARFNTNGLNNNPSTIQELLTSNFLDFDAPDPALYPRGMLLWNTRRSYGNVKRYIREYVDTLQDNPRFNREESMSSYFPDRWVTASPNNEDGSGSFGRRSQRGVVVAALKSALDTSEEARDDERRNFNIIACPGYPETLSNLVNLNIDRKLTAFVIGDTPLRLRADTTSLLNYATNAKLVTDNGDDGIVTFDEYAAVYYPNGFTTDLSGSNAVVPASHMMLRTMILSDRASYPWFAPAGTRRGGITNATSVGFIDANTGEFKTVALNGGQRDTLYEQKINPIPFFVGVGHIAYGQKTRARNDSAIDRINVSRLVVYLRSQLNRLARPYLFEPNDKKTRDEVKSAVESLLIELVGLRAIFDFAVVCDESNNTPDRVDRNELWVDVAIEPTKAVEFIYIPLRLKNTGEI